MLPNVTEYIRELIYSSTVEIVAIERDLRVLREFPKRIPTSQKVTIEACWRSRSSSGGLRKRSGFRAMRSEVAGSRESCQICSSKWCPPREADALYLYL